MPTRRRNRLVSLLLLAEAVLIACIGLTIGQADDAPGAGLLGLLLGSALAFAAWRAWRCPRAR